MLKVTFESKCKVKENRRWVMKTFRFEEQHKTKSDAQLRALALNWTIVKIEE